MLLQVIGKLNIGEVSNLSVENGTVIQIPTGGVVPNGANAVIMVEDTRKITEDSEFIEIINVLHPGKNISKQGEDIQKGELLFESGHKLRSVDRGYLLSAGIKEIKVTCPPTVAIITTGDELVAPWDEIPLGKIPDINSVNLADMCCDEGWNPEIIGIIKDIKQELESTIKDCVKQYDVVLINGGTSVGKKDFVPVILDELGEVLFHGLAMRPGSPVMCAKIDNKVVFGVPGFPTATIIAFQFVIKPILLSLMGVDDPNPLRTIEAKISRNVGSKLGRLDYLRVNIVRSKNGGYDAVPIQIGGSGVLQNIVKANGFIPIPESSEGLKKGDNVEVILW
jgi:molybdenum cofactor synthesis domain-containing protein